MGRKAKSGPKPQALPEALQLIIYMYLDELRGMAVRGVESCSIMESMAPTLPGVAGNKQYWQGIISAIDYALTRIPTRMQFTLLIQQMDPFDKISENLSWGDVQAKAGLTYVAHDCSPTIVTVEQSQPTCQPTSELQVPPVADTRQPWLESNGSGKESETKSLPLSNATQCGSSPPNAKGSDGPKAKRRKNRTS